MGLFGLLASVAGLSLTAEARAQRLAPERTEISRIVLTDGGAWVRWTGTDGPGYAYTLQYQDDSLGGEWRAVPTTGCWPADVTEWLDTPPPTTKARFYRIVAVQVPGQRGRLLSCAHLRSVPLAEIQAALALLGVDEVPQTGVELYKLVYGTVDAWGAPTTASGALVVPIVRSNALPLLSYQHGTVTRKIDVPSEQNPELLVGVAFGSTGYVAASPDYLGLGESPGFHPYHHAKSEATATIDLLRAARTFCASHAIALNDQLFLCGYSQGGHATMAAHRELEAFHADEFTITASAPMAGAYDLSGVTTADFLSGRSMPNPYYYAYLLVAYQEVYRFASSLADVLVSPYDVTLPPLLNGQHDGGEINQALGTSVPVQMLRPEFLEAFTNDPNHPLRQALRDNDLYEWTPRAPLRLYHCQGDRDVLRANSEVAFDSFQQRGASQVQLLDPLPTGDHGDCVLPSLLEAKAWFDSLRQ